MALAPSSPDIMYVLLWEEQGGRFFRSLNAGLTWHERHIFPTPGQDDIRDLVVDPENPDVVYANGTAGL